MNEQGIAVGQQIGGAANTPHILADNPKNVRIMTVLNGFTVNLEGGKQKENELYVHNKLHVAKTKEEALEIASNFLEE